MTSQEFKWIAEELNSALKECEYDWGLQIAVRLAAEKIEKRLRVECLNFNVDKFYKTVFDGVKEE